MSSSKDQYPDPPWDQDEICLPKSMPGIDLWDSRGFHLEECHSAEHELVKRVKREDIFTKTRTVATNNNSQMGQLIPWDEFEQVAIEYRDAERAGNSCTTDSLAPLLDGRLKQIGALACNNECDFFVESAPFHMLVRRSRSEARIAIYEPLEEGSFAGFSRTCLDRLWLDELRRRNRIHSREVNIETIHELSVIRHSITIVQSVLSSRDDRDFLETLSPRDRFEFLAFEGLYVLALEVEPTDDGQKRHDTYWHQCVERYGEYMGVNIGWQFRDIPWNKLNKGEAFDAVAKLLYTSPASRKKQREDSLSDSEIVKRLSQNLRARFFRKRERIYQQIPTIAAILSRFEEG